MEAALEVTGFPPHPNARIGDLPVMELLAAHEIASLVQDPSESLSFHARACNQVLKHVSWLKVPIASVRGAKRETPARNFKRITKLAIKPSPDGGFVLLVQLQPGKRVKDLDEAVQWTCFLFNAIEQRLRLMDLSDVDVIDAFELLHGERLRHRLLHRFVHQELPAPLAEAIHGF